MSALFLPYFPLKMFQTSERPVFTLGFKIAFENLFVGGIFHVSQEGLDAKRKN